VTVGLPPWSGRAQGHRGSERTQAVPTSGGRRPVARLRYVGQPRRTRAAFDGPHRRTRQRLPRSTANPRLLDRGSSDLGAADGWVRLELGPLTAHREPASTEMITTVATRNVLRRDPAAPVSIPPLRARFGVDPGRFAQSALPGLALDGVGSALDREFSGADRCPAGCAYGQRVKLGSAGVLEDDGLVAGVDVVVAPFLQGEDDRT
jgi:hypothetical protein